VVTVAGLIAAAIAVALLGLYGLARQAEPAYSGRLELAGLARPVEVEFGPHAVPSVRAETLADLFFAQGYLLARERLWQMDLMRRLARGRLSEVMGERTVPVDRLFRVLGLERSAEASLAGLDAQVRGYLEAYAQGVNAYRDEARARLPLEYRLAGFDPAPWGPVDSLAVLDYLAFALSFNLRQEVGFLKLAARVGPARARELFPADEGLPTPAFPPELAETLPSAAETARGLGRALALATGLQGPGGPASNSWVVTGARSESGLPLLANDPHLAPTMPSVWYELELDAPGFHVTGLSLPGVPFVLIGHNEHLAWGLTTAMADTQDLFLERPTPDGEAVERASGEPEAVVSWTERIEVDGRDEPESLVVRSTSNGVVLNDVLVHPPGTPLDLPGWDAAPLLVTLRSSLELADRSAEALFGFGRAETPEHLVEAARLVRHASQKVMYAHRDGAAGWYVTGALPLRRRGEGAFPAPAWTGGYGWIGYLPAADNPAVSAAPPREGLVAANDRALPDGYRAQFGSTWAPPYRAERIRALLEERDRFSADELVRMQVDVESTEVRRYRQALAALEPELRRVDPEAWAIGRRRLLEWDGRFEADSASGAFLVLLRPRLAAALLEDELGEDLRDLLALSAFTYNALQAVVASGRSSFWDDLRTPDEEPPAEIWARALRGAEQALTGGLADPAEARLDRVRELVFPHAFHWVPGLGPLFDVGPVAARGDDQTVAVMKSSLLEPRTVQYVASYRAVLTPGEWGRSRGTNTLGQSGHRFSPYRDDQLADWLAGRAHAWPWGGVRGAEPVGRLTLAPP
jgi:acyl-homoserine lactone acylase PvdQ